MIDPLVPTLPAIGTPHQGTSPGGDVTPAELPHPLTERELEVLRLVATGMRNREIAGELFVTVDTVKKHVSHILDKLASTNRTEAVAEAVDSRNPRSAG